MHQPRVTQLCCLKKNQTTPCCSILRIVVVLFALTDRASTIIHSNIRGYQSDTWSQQGGTKVNGSPHGDNPLLLRPTGIQIATKSATLQAMAPTNIKMVHQTSLLHIESSLDRLGLLSPTHDQRSQQQSGQITLQQAVLINKSKFLQGGHTAYKNKEN